MSDLAAATPVNGADRAAAASVPSRQRSAVTNGRRLFVVGDGNSAWSRRFKDLVAGHLADMGGADVLSEAQKSLVRRAATLEVELEQMDGQASLGEEIDLDAYGRATNTAENAGIARPGA